MNGISNVGSITTWDEWINEGLININQLFIFQCFGDKIFNFSRDLFSISYILVWFYYSSALHLSLYKIYIWNYIKHLLRILILYLGNIENVVTYVNHSKSDLYFWDRSKSTFEIHWDLIGSCRVSNTYHNLISDCKWSKFQYCDQYCKFDGWARIIFNRI